MRTHCTRLKVPAIKHPVRPARYLCRCHLRGLWCMRIATWNANGGLDAPNASRTNVSNHQRLAKSNYLSTLAYDLVVVPEYGTREPDPSCFPRGTKFLRRDSKRKNNSPNGPKGLAIACSIGCITEYGSNAEEAYLACYWHVANQHIRVVAVHAQEPNYCARTIDVLATLGTWLRAGPSIIAGDLNTNGALKVGDNARKFDRLWNEIERANLGSAWHIARSRDPHSSPHFRGT
jgi:hypothetical protein